MVEEAIGALSNPPRGVRPRWGRGRRGLIFGVAVALIIAGVGYGRSQHPTSGRAQSNEIQNAVASLSLTFSSSAGQPATIELSPSTSTLQLRLESAAHGAARVSVCSFFERVDKLMAADGRCRTLDGPDLQLAIAVGHARTQRETLVVVVGPSWSSVSSSRSAVLSRPARGSSSSPAINLQDAIRVAQTPAAFPDWQVMRIRVVRP